MNSQYMGVVIGIGIVIISLILAILIKEIIL